jgi:queuine tRNA-ribosyltransferase
VSFQSHLDGSKLFLSPEKVVEIQADLGVDVAMVLDECTPYPCERVYVQKSLERTTRWAERCLTHWRKIKADKYQHLFAIVQGSVYQDLRLQSAQELVDLDFPGYAIGGLAVGEPNDLMYEMLDYTLPVIPSNKPRYLMGVGTPENILEAVARGVDMFDCVLPTRNARHGMVFTSTGDFNLTRAKWAQSNSPIDKDCNCPTCQKYSLAYLRHLFNINDILAMRLATIHNLHFYSQLMQGIRQSIIDNKFNEFKSKVIKKRQD